MKHSHDSRILVVALRPWPFGPPLRGRAPGRYEDPLAVVRKAGKPTRPRHWPLSGPRLASSENSPMKREHRDNNERKGVKSKSGRDRNLKLLFREIRCKSRPQVSWR
jgi:hypothetical protein